MIERAVLRGIEMRFGEGQCLSAALRIGRDIIVPADNNIRDIARIVIDQFHTVRITEIVRKERAGEDRWQA